MADEKTLYALLNEGVSPGELADEVEKGNVLWIDNFGRDGQFPSAASQEKIIDCLEFYQQMLWERDLPDEIRTCDRYWGETWYWMGEIEYELPHVLVRAYLRENVKVTKSKPVELQDMAATANARWAKPNEQKVAAAQASIPMITRGKLKHNVIANELLNTGNYPYLSKKMMDTVVKEQCDKMKRSDLVIGRKKS